MYSLIEDSTNGVVELGAAKRLHWRIGRHPTCDVVIDDPGISRFHATIFYAGEELFLIDHSINGTHLGRSPEDLREITERPLPLDVPAAPEGDDTQVIEPFMRVLDSPDVDPADPNKSLAEFRLAQSRTRVPRVAGYESNRPTSPETAKTLLDMIYSDTESHNLAAMGRRLERGMSIVVVGRQPHLYSIRGEQSE